MNRGFHQRKQAPYIFNESENYMILRIADQFPGNTLSFRTKQGNSKKYFLFKKHLF